MRAVVIDGRIGFTGGFGIADRWLGDGQTPNQWRDTNVRVEGPAAMQLQVAFSNNWAEATGDLLIGVRRGAVALRADARDCHGTRPKIDCQIFRLWGRLGFDVGRKTRGACRGAGYLVKPSANL